MRVYGGGALLGTPALDLGSRVCSNDERGLLRVTVDPDFANNGYVYLYSTFKKYDRCPEKDPGNPRNPVNRVSRFVLTGDTVDENTGEEILIDNIPSPNGNHNGGDLHFGKNGHPYVSVGDGGCTGQNRFQYKNNASRKRHVLLGKSLRIEPDGGIPQSNQYTDPVSSGRCNVTRRTERGDHSREAFAWGFRNPIRMAFDPDTPGTTTRLFINDVGGQKREEIDEGEAGADYGWNLCEGSLDNPYRRGSVDCSVPTTTYSPPIHEYSHDDEGCHSITGGAFVPDAAFWSTDASRPDGSYDGAYLFGDFICNKIFKLTPTAGGGFEETTFSTDLEGGGPIAMTFGPYTTTAKALYYTTFADVGQVHRISNTGGS